MGKCQILLGNAVKNTGVFVCSKPIFQMNCLVHVLAGVCKYGVLTVVDGDVDLATKTIRHQMQQYIARKKSQKGVISLATYQ